MKVSTIYHAVANAEFHYRKQNRCPLLGLTDLLNLQVSSSQVGELVYDMSFIETNKKVSFELPTEEACSNYFEQACPLLIAFMKKHPGKLFIAGGHVASLLIGGLDDDRNRHFDLDVFIVEESAEAAELLLTNLMKSFPEIHHLSSNSQVTSFDVPNMKAEELQVVRRVYPSPDVILMKFDLWACQYLWSPSTGIRMTPMGMAAYIMKAFPEDCSMHSMSVNMRRHKYLQKGFRCLLPGLPEGAMPMRVGPEKANIQASRVRRNLFGAQPREESEEDDSTTPRDAVDSDEEIGNRAPRREVRSPSPDPEAPDAFEAAYEDLRPQEPPGAPRKPKKIVEGAVECYQRFKVEWMHYEESDYHGDQLEDFMNPWNLVMGKSHRVTMFLDKYEDFCDMSVARVLKDTFGNWLDLDEMSHTANPDTLKKMFITTEMYKRWATLYYVEGDRGEAARVWHMNLHALAEPIIKMFGPGTRRVDLWKTDNPGSQAFGQSSPLKVTPQEFYGACYRPTYVGIKPDVYPIIELTFRRYGAPRDIRRLLMWYVLKAQADHALKFLLCIA